MSARVSVVLRTCNRADYLRESIESVLAQTFRDFELIVVDDGSTDSTPTLVASYGTRIRSVFIVPRTGNLAATFNTGVRAAPGELVAFLDDDDLWLPEKLARQVEVLDRNPRFGFAYGNARFVYPDGSLSPPALAPDEIVMGPALRTIVRNMCVHPSTLIVRHHWLDRAGFLDETRRIAETFPFCLRLAQLTEAACIPEPVCLIRRHGTQTSREQALSSYDAAVDALETLLRDRALPWGVRLEAHRSIARYETHVARTLAEAGKLAEARRRTVRALVRFPFHRPAWRWALRSLIGG